MTGGTAYAATVNSQAQSTGYYINGDFFNASDVLSNPSELAELNNLLAQNPTGLYLDLNGQIANYAGFIQYVQQNHLSASNSVFDAYAQANPFTIPSTATLVTPSGNAPYYEQTISAVNSSVGVFPSSITDGQAFTMTVTVNDANGDPVSGLSASSFVLNVNGKFVTASAAVYQGNGTYVLTFLPTTLTPGPDESEALVVDGTTVATSVGVDVSAGSVSTSGSTAVFPSNSVLDASGTYTVTVNLEDAIGNPISGATGTPTVSLGTGANAIPLTATALKAVTSTPGEYTFTFTAPTVSVSTALPLVVNVDGVTLTSTQTYTVTSDTPTALALESSLPATLEDGATYTVTVGAVDANGELVPTTSLATTTTSWTVEFAGNSATIKSVTTASTPGEYEVTFQMPSVTAGYVSKLTISDTTNNLSLTTSNSYTAGAGISSAASSVTWPSTTTLVEGQSYTVTVDVVDTSSNPVTGLTTSDFSITGPSTTIESVTPGSTSGSYVVTFELTTTTPGTLDVVVDGTTITSSPLTVTSVESTSVSAVTLSTLDGATASSVSAPVLLPGSSNTVTLDAGAVNLTSSDFSVELGNTPLSVTSVEPATTAGYYTLTFTAPNTTVSTPETLTFTVGTATTSINDVTVENNISATASTVVSGGPSTTTWTEGSTATFTVNVENASGDPVLGLPTSTFDITLGNSSNLVTSVTEDGGSYTVTVQAPNTVVTSATFSVSVDGVTITNGVPTSSYNVVASEPATFNSSVTFPSGNALHELIAGQTYTITATLDNAQGNPVLGLTTSDFALGYTTSSVTTTNGADTLPELPTSSFAVTGNSNGTYTITFVPTSASSSAEYLALLVDSQGVTTKGSSVSTSTSGAVFGDSTSLSVLPGAPEQLAVTAATATVSSTNSPDAVTVTLEDAYGNPITSDSSDVVTFSLATGSATGATLSATTATLSSGTASVTVTTPASSSDWGTGSSITVDASVTVNGHTYTGSVTIDE
ncbi:hypothetical protein TC41_0355 [Alicyclobacillus acidocaldarius subsp. acidocaldarius Tc-4-1]|uniref:Big-1 domain-containing protein n=2 Tax=Alicyclobacillus acidocaldarius TaxID=405212 RepID=F8IKD3_ALIAT|nr:hypothetical protein TC41_0355 [Alicyclobacillus acidocaldarius subsp. acidocaldarius Tc-4-1]